MPNSVSIPHGLTNTSTSKRSFLDFTINKKKHQQHIQNAQNQQMAKDNQEELERLRERVSQLGAANEKHSRDRHRNDEEVETLIAKNRDLAQKNDCLMNLLRDYQRDNELLRKTIEELTSVGYQDAVQEEDGAQDQDGADTTSTTNDQTVMVEDAIASIEDAMTFIFTNQHPRQLLRNRSFILEKIETVVEPRELQYPSSSLQTIEEKERKTIVTFSNLLSASMKMPSPIQSPRSPLVKSSPRFPAPVVSSGTSSPQITIVQAPVIQSSHPSPSSSAMSTPKSMSELNSPCSSSIIDSPDLSMLNSSFGTPIRPHLSPHSRTKSLIMAVNSGGGSFPSRKGSSEDLSLSLNSATSSPDSKLNRKFNTVGASKLMFSSNGICNGVGSGSGAALLSPGGSINKRASILVQGSKSIISSYQPLSTSSRPVLKTPSMPISPQFDPVKHFKQPTELESLKKSFKL
ncbi:hypothetical protein SAMD00019534_077000 [Acytostelium subglobosum LB1]|uniref:hypothetical protein n=1 Tax=Acytostelium subglobosum LB1 TaxID=1410327 RepID=UPI000644B7C3|nr:hypothetical protein SAMD00019534_077000 [Acytostelium subglobosum LB1]GAM24525.1 hypothetical protein SAMD00019534_077000 [Acytostelium subglobosum LB1]|eukprot:XP_012752851.1 hypothetical protein SAMD00019534_077000 [Acytostelium subglobosum LB1]